MRRVNECERLQQRGGEKQQNQSIVRRTEVSCGEKRRTIRDDYVRTQIRNRTTVQSAKLRNR